MDGNLRAGSGAWRDLSSSLAGSQQEARFVGLGARVGRPGGDGGGTDGTEMLAVSPSLGVGWDGLHAGQVMLCESSWALGHVPGDWDSALESRKKHLRTRWR